MSDCDKQGILRAVIAVSLSEQLVLLLWVHTNACAGFFHEVRFFQSNRIFFSLMFLIDTLHEK
jgi:hypothetical protein